jgi:hypothetical protein
LLLTYQSNLSICMFFFLYLQHIGGGWYESVNKGIWCVDVQKFFLPFGEQEPRPSKSGLPVALRLCEFARLKGLATKLNSIQEIANAMTCQHSNPEDIMLCPECKPFAETFM